MMAYATHPSIYRISTNRSPLLPAARRDWHKRRARLELFGCLSRNVTSASRCVSCVAMSFSDSRNPHFGPFASPSRAALRRASSRRPACQCSKKPENSFFALSPRAAPLPQIPRDLRTSECHASQGFGLRIMRCQRTAISACREQVLRR